MTKGKGVDIVLNSLAEEKLDASYRMCWQTGDGLWKWGSLTWHRIDRWECLTS